MTKKEIRERREKLISENKLIVRNGIEMYDTPFGLMCVNPDDFWPAFMCGPFGRGDYNVESVQETIIKSLR